MKKGKAAFPERRWKVRFQKGRENLPYLTKGENAHSWRKEKRSQSWNICEETLLRQKVNGGEIYWKWKTPRKGEKAYISKG
jgi:hypothetical protein